jgi:5-methylcytosine-specific restriction endonuclease McrA
MAQPRLQAQFFAGMDGVVLIREKQLNYDQRLAVFNRDGGKCKQCGEPVKFGGNEVSPFSKIRAGHIDHIFPRARGGRNDDSNLRLLCMSCNSRKGAK